MILKIVNTLIALFCLIATASHAQNADPGSTSTSNGVPAGFSILDKHASNFIRVDPQANWARYRVYNIMPAVYEPDGSRHSLSPKDALRVSATVDRSLQKTFRKFGEDSGEVLEVRPIVTAVKRTSTLLNLLGFAAIQAPISFGGASLRYELFDSGTGKQIGVISCKRSARPWNVYPWNLLQNFEALGQGSVILKSDSKKLRNDLDRLSKLGIDPAHSPVERPAAGAE